MTEEWLKEFEAATNAATKGPWRLFASGKTVEVQFDGNRSLVKWNGFDSSDTPVAQQRRNALFMALAREGVPALFAEVRRLQADNAHLRRLLDYAIGAEDMDALEEEVEARDAE